MTVILSKRLRLLRLQWFIFAFMFDILSEKFRANILSRMVSNVIPNSFKLLTSRFRFHLDFIESALYYFEPVHTPCVFEKFNLRPELFCIIF